MGLLHALFRMWQLSSQYTCRFALDNCLPQASQQTSQGGGSRISQSQGGGGNSSKGIDPRDTAIVKPDTKQMMPFKPSSTSGTPKQSTRVCIN